MLNPKSDRYVGRVDGFRRWKAAVRSTVRKSMAAFDNRKDVERWLEGRSQADAIALAVRAALRAAPALWKMIGPSILQYDQRIDIAQLYFALSANAWAEVSSRDTLSFFGDLPSDEVRRFSALKIYTESAQSASQRRIWDFLAAARATSASRFAKSAAVAATTSDAIRFAVDAVSEATVAASLTVNNFRPSSTASKSGFSACAADATALEAGVHVGQLLDRPLWPNGAPPWVGPNWKMTREYLSIQDKNRDDWGLWYERRLRGAASGCEPRRTCAISRCDLRRLSHLARRPFNPVRPTFAVATRRGYDAGDFYGSAGRVGRLGERYRLAREL
jgi:hypothetical protein